MYKIFIIDIQQLTLREFALLFDSVKVQVPANAALFVEIVHDLHSKLELSTAVEPRVL